MGAQKTCRFFHFLVQIVADRGGLQIFLKLAVQCGCADPRMMDKYNIETGINRWKQIK